MAGWSNIPQSAGDNWASAAGAWAELFAACDERAAVVPGAVSATAPAAGDVIANKDLIQDIQAWIEYNAGWFVATIDAGGSPVTDYHGEDSIEFWSWDKLKARIPGLSSGWTRKNDAGTSNGQQAAGYYASYIKLMNDLRLVLNELVWTRDSVDWAGSGKGSPVYTPRISWAAAKSHAESEFDSSSGGTASSPPRRYSYGVKSNSGFTAHLRNVYGSASATGIATGYAKAADLYVFASAYGSDDGDIWGTDNAPTGLLQDAWGKIYTENLASGASSITTTSFNGTSHSKPPWCAEPGIRAGTSLGWRITNSRLVLRWDVSGGFTYY